MSKVAAVACGMVLAVGLYAMMMDPKDKKIMMKKAEKLYEDMVEDL